MSSISLIIPTLDEAENIPKLLFQIKKVNEIIKPIFKLKVIIVDDSKDNKTVTAAASFRQKENLPIKIIHRRQRGLASAVICGFQKSQDEILGVMDADLSHPPNLLIKMLGEIKHYDLVVASRYINGGGIEKWSIIRKLESKIATQLAYWLGIKIKDPLSGFFLLHRKVIDNVVLKPIGYKILLEILIKGNYNNVVEIPYLFKNRTIGKSKIGFKIIIDYLKHIIKLYNWQRQKKRLLKR